jgi:hypothetical protein
MVTAEFAVALPAFVIVVIAAVCGVVVVTAQLRCVDAAAVAARMAGRGEPAAVVAATALSGAPGGSELSIQQTATTVTAVVRSRLSLPLLGSVLPAVTLNARIAEPREPGARSPAAQP